ncbi:hypothetical protein K437DRAFT_253691 [Tilletiaria anomala UBC 951]|uniref:Uncharacterized protein n=1 Tax=Tilletiaria anomala (strain ATCC 24038 / CBS 436.72 / UBC 951) TaxID=1037660 RepID=A0A066WGD2_TILAU|nr:uncharacterized protein K437DRAFT_253691 [Tilletiaria anomala UBC 951]KDN53037.1 hypothetical protein K437DRAFT_253691 [Tilletiaria anomala UBC 951]
MSNTSSLAQAAHHGAAQSEHYQLPLPPPPPHGAGGVQGQPGIPMSGLAPPAPYDPSLNLHQQQQPHRLQQQQHQHQHPQVQQQQQQQQQYPPFQPHAPAHLNINAGNTFAGQPTPSQPDSALLQLYNASHQMPAQPVGQHHPQHQQEHRQYQIQNQQHQFQEQDSQQYMPQHQPIQHAYQLLPIDPQQHQGSSEAAPASPLKDVEKGVGIVRTFVCEFCQKAYTGLHSRSIFRRHLSVKHGIPLNSQPKSTRWDADPLRPKDDQERRERMLESKRNWAKKHRAQLRETKQQEVTDGPFKPGRRKRKAATQSESGAGNSSSRMGDNNKKRRSGNQDDDQSSDISEAELGGPDGAPDSLTAQDAAERRQAAAAAAAVAAVAAAARVPSPVPPTPAPISSTDPALEAAEALASAAASARGPSPLTPHSMHAPAVTDWVPTRTGAESEGASVPAPKRRGRPSRASAAGHTTAAPIESTAGDSMDTCIMYATAPENAGASAAADALAAAAAAAAAAVSPSALPASSTPTNIHCSLCDKVYKGKQARVNWRKHLNDMHGVPLSWQPKRGGGGGAGTWRTSRGGNPANGGQEGAAGLEDANAAGPAGEDEEGAVEREIGQ